MGQMYIIYVIYIDQSILKCDIISLYLKLYDNWHMNKQVFGIGNEQT